MIVSMEIDGHFHLISQFKGELTSPLDNKQYERPQRFGSVESVSYRLVKPLKSVTLIESLKSLTLNELSSKL